MGELWHQLAQPFVWHALIAATVAAVSCGLIAPLVLSRGVAFAVHGISELAFTGAAAGLLLGGNPVIGALLGSLVVATVMGVLGVRERERDSSIGVILAFGLGVGVLLLSFNERFATQATNILFGNILHVSGGQIWLLVGVGLAVTLGLAAVYRPLQFASVDSAVAEARGVPVRLLGIIFLLILALTVTQAAQIVGTLLVLSLTITPAAAAARLSARPIVVTMLSIGFALVAADGGLVASVGIGRIEPSAYVAFTSFGIYLAVRLGMIRSSTSV